MCCLRGDLPGEALPGGSGTRGRQVSGRAPSARSNSVVALPCLLIAVFAVAAQKVSVPSDDQRYTALFPQQLGEIGEDPVSGASCPDGTLPARGSAPKALAAQLAGLGQEPTT